MVAAMTEIRAEPDPEVRARLEKEARDRVSRIPLPDISWVLRQVQHAIQVGGEDVIGLGGDLDGISTMPAGLTGVESYPFLADTLCSGGLSERQVEKVCWRNLARVFEEVLPAE
jgi:membrane dipeptidase